MSPINTKSQKIRLSFRKEIAGSNLISIKSSFYLSKCVLIDKNKFQLNALYIFNMSMLQCDKKSLLIKHSLGVERWYYI